jgi:hypothetical protein
MPAGNRTRASAVVGEHSRVVEKIHSNSLLMAIWNIYMWARDQWRMLTTVPYHNASSLSIKVPFQFFLCILFYFKVWQCCYLCSYVLAAYLPELECVQPEAEHEEIGATRHGTPRAGTSHRIYCFLTSPKPVLRYRIRCFFDPWIRDPG